MSDQFVVITGVSTGIGYSCTKVFLNNGFKVIGSVRKQSDADRLGTELGADFFPVIFDIAKSEEIAPAVNQIKEIVKGKGIACLINNAGIAVTGPLMHIPTDEIRHQFEVNVFGLFDFTKSLLPLLGAVKNYSNTPGKIIIISSVAGQMSMPFMGPYTGSKHALEGMSNSLRRELLIYGIDVIIVAPGPVKTPIWGKGLGNEPSDEIANSDYGPLISRLTKQYRKEEEKALDSDELGENIFRIFKAKSPRAHYIFRKQKFVKWTIPRYILSARLFDRVIKKMLKL